jgi:glycosyltransferase involved in cell wall biosynthesis
MTQTPLVSVILPTHNRAALLPRAIRSVLAQTYRNLELWVVDDASSDATPEVVRQFDDPRLHYLRLDTNRRAAGARNAAIRKARGTLLAFQDDDDLWLVQKLEHQVAHLLSQPADVGLSLCSLLRVFPQKADCVGASSFARMRFDRGPVGDFSITATPCWLLRREVFDRLGEFDERLRIWEDWELVYRLSRRYRIAHLDQPLVVQDRTRAAGQGINSVVRDQAIACRMLLEKHGHQWHHRAALSRQYYLIGRSDALHVSQAAALPWFRRAVRTNPLSVKAWGALLLSHAGDGAVSRAVRGLNFVRNRRSGT